MNKKNRGKKKAAIAIAIFTLAIMVSVQMALTAELNETDAADEDTEYSALAGDNNKMDVAYLVAQEAAKIAKKELSFSMNDPNILAMTDAGYPIVGGKAGGKTTEPGIDAITASTGCTIGNGNLLLIQRGKEKPLWFAFFDKETKRCVYLEVKDSVLEKSSKEFKKLSNVDIFSIIAVETIGADELLSNPEAWNPKMDAQVFGGNEFSIITIANVWAKGAPYEFLNAAEFHNHICPGVTSGYFIVKYLDENLPLLSSSDNYEIIGCPPWCKDDAIQVIFDKTVGKRYVAMHLTPEDSEQLPDVAGIYIRWNSTVKNGDGLVLTFNWTKARAVCEIDPAYEKEAWYWWWMRLKMDMGMTDYLDDPGIFVSTMHAFNVGSTAEIEQLKYAGVNPYVELGLLPDPALAKLVGADNICVDNLLGWRAGEIAKENLSFAKYDADVLAMTDAGYAIVDGKAGGKTTEKCIDGIIASTGCTVGKGNLLLIHGSKEKPLWFQFYNNATGECLYLEVNNSIFDVSIEEFAALPDEAVFTVIAKVSPGSIPSVWAKGAPYELLKAAEFHNHICPGLTSGYVIVRYLDENLPLQSSSDSYEIIGCPPWCKDDALQVIFDKTVGKRFVAMHLTEENKTQLPDVAGIYIRWNRTAETGQGLVLAFNWTKTTEICGDVSKLEKTLCMMDYLDQPEMFVSTMHAFNVSNTAEIEQLKYAGVNPYVELGLL
jgi:formylmethanofuran dehydrogenase subunit E-like metal-binding protein